MSKSSGDPDSTVNTPLVLVGNFVGGTEAEHLFVDAAFDDVVETEKRSVAGREI